MIEQLTRPQPIQFGLAKLIQFMTVAALWCGAAIVRDNVVLGMAYSVVVVAATWIVVGRWAATLSPVMCRRVLAATTTLLVAGGFGVTALVEDETYFPLVWMLTALVAALPWTLMEFGVVWGVVAGIACDALLLLLIYSVWLAVFRSWDRFSARPDQRRLARSFSLQLVLLALPVGLSILCGCYAFHEHTGALDMHHLWLHCIIHIAMVAAACWIVVLLQRHARRSTDPPPNWLKLVTWGYLCYYAVLLQVALFPINFYIP
ncbi:MAG: hypothetical protein O3C40_13095 [Planctomycetota bacterium]|nr:hypothetical protein [Planctomycetota bacterium]